MRARGGAGGAQGGGPSGTRGASARLHRSVLPRAPHLPLCQNLSASASPLAAVLVVRAGGRLTSSVSLCRLDAYSEALVASATDMR
jgi:hypothetical protein